MRIQVFLLVILLFVLLNAVWRRLFSTQQFLQPLCISGKASESEESVSIIDCSICLTFPTQIHQSGNIQIRNGMPYISNLQQNNLNEYKLFMKILMQEDCIQYQCSSIGSGGEFLDSVTLSRASLVPVGQVQKPTNKQWAVISPYDNYIKKRKNGNSILNRLISNVIGTLLPYMMMESRQFYNGMAVKLRYSQPSQATLQKPIVKITSFQQANSDYFVISIIVAFTLATNLSMFKQGSNLGAKYINILMSLCFIAPRLFSFIALILLVSRNKFHITSLFLYLVSQCFDKPEIIILGIMLSSFIEYWTQNPQVDIETLILLNSVIVMALLLNIQSLTQCSPIILWAFCFPSFDSSYSRINNSQNSSKNLAKFRAIDQNDELSG